MRDEYRPVPFGLVEFEELPVRHLALAPLARRLFNAALRLEGEEWHDKHRRRHVEAIDIVRAHNRRRRLRHRQL